MAASVKFGTSGLRGLAGVLLAGPAQAHAGAFCRMLSANCPADSSRRVLVGRDQRPSSPQLARQIITAIEASGFTASDCGLVPTPALALAAQSRNACAIMVTGSHIPADRNGLKFYSPAGEITKKEEEAIAIYAEEQSGAVAAYPETDGNDSLEDAVLAEWLERCGKICPPGSLSGMKIGVFEGSSVATGPLTRILSYAGAAVMPFGRNEAFVPLDTEAVDDELLQECRRRISEHRLDCVVSADPDGDRPLVIAGDGAIVRGDMLGWMAARQIGADHISTTVNANSAIAGADGIEVARTKIGSPHVIESIVMAAESGARCPVGFEPNGGFLLGGDCAIGAGVGAGKIARLVTRDSFLPILSLLGQMAESGKPISQLAAELQFHAAASGRLENIPGEISRALIARLGSGKTEQAKFFHPFGNVDSVDWTDGMRVSLTTGSAVKVENVRQSERIIHLRPSGNAPELRCYVEDATEDGALALLRECLARVASALASR